MLSFANGWGIFRFKLFITCRHFLLYDSQIESVIYARDKYLAKEGIILPDRAALFISSLEDEAYKNKRMDFW